MHKDLPKIIWFVIPLFVALMPYVARIINLETDRYMYSEFGIIENLTVLFLFVTIIVCIMYLVSEKRFNFVGFKFWMGLFLLGAIYYAGEEISWGQHFFGWETPEHWTNVNDQQETNLHNTSALFDQIPRSLLSLAALIGGVIVPIYRKVKQYTPNLDSLNYWLWPTSVCLPSALLALLVSWHEKVYEFFDINIPIMLDIRAGETKECLLALFMMMYVLSIWYRNRVIKKV